MSLSTTVQHFFERGFLHVIVEVFATSCDVDTRVTVTGGYTTSMISMLSLEGGGLKRRRHYFRRTRRHNCNILCKKL